MIGRVRDCFGGCQQETFTEEYDQNQLIEEVEGIGVDNSRRCWSAKRVVAVGACAAVGLAVLGTLIYGISNSIVEPETTTGSPLNNITFGITPVSIFQGQHYNHSGKCLESRNGTKGFECYLRNLCNQTVSVTINAIQKYISPNSTQNVTCSDSYAALQQNSTYSD